MAILPGQPSSLQAVAMLFPMFPKKILVLSWLVLVLSLAWSVRMGWFAAHQYMGDLRNRVVGARMVSDGRSPYFYKWQPADGIRYYDPDNFDSLKVSNTTATPLFHRLLIPLSNAAEKNIQMYWVLLQYLLFAATVWMGWLAASNSLQKTVVLLVSAVFLQTDAWTMEIANGQVYIIVPFLAMAFYHCLRSAPLPSYRLLLAGFIAAVFIGIRPNALLFLLPFLWWIRKRSLKQGLLLFSVPVLLLAWVLFQPGERMLWQDYRLHLNEQVKVHQDMLPSLQQNAPRPSIQQWEGIDISEMQRQERWHPIRFNSENGNLFVLVNSVTHQKIPVFALAVLLLLCILSFLLLFYRKYRGSATWSVAEMALAGYLLLMIADFLSPVHRHQYYAVQWLFPLLMLANGYRRMNPWWLMVLGGLLLNCADISFIKMEHTIGELLMLTGCSGWLLGDKTSLSK